MTRTRLPDRRPAETRELCHQGQRFTVTVGFDLTGRPLEVFADGRTSQLGHAISDACVAVSLALQHGCPPQVLVSAMGRVPDHMQGEDRCAPASFVGCIAEAVLAAGRRGEP